ncbi:MAG: hypothetical protein HUU20_21300 [Pirellulales bacterium]|nr:hypothetical protein [Pirellulales bacterium]
MVDCRRLLRTLAVFLAIFNLSVEGAEPLPDDVAMRKLTDLRETVESTCGCIDEKIPITLLTADWPDDLMPTVRATLSMILREPRVQIPPWAVGVFARRNGEGAAPLVPYVAASLPGAEPRDAVELLCAIRSIGPRANPLEEIVRSKCNDPNAVVAIHAASALVRIAPTRRYPRGVLLSYLSSDRPEDRWRAADAIARTGASDERWSQRLRELLKDGDVRVRVTSAFALWRSTNDPAVTFPVLVASLTERDASLATAFEYPSRPGDSHRAYAIQAILDLGDSGKPALRDIIAVVKGVASTDTVNSDFHSVVGIVALNAIGKLGPVSEREFKEIEASVECEECAFAIVRDEARRVLSRLRKSLPRKSDNRVE